MEKNDTVTFKLREEASNFFLYAYFGIVADPNGMIKETPYSAIIKCVYRAYLDMCRTLKVKKDDLSFAKEYCSKIAEKLVNCTSLSEMKSSFYSTFFEEDSLKSNELEAYLDIRENSNRKDFVFHYGQAQKWANMTFKYMWLIGLIDDEDTNDLEVPIDRFILKTISKDKTTESAIPWSELNKEEYESLREVIKTEANHQGTPIDWECKTWINMAAEEASRQKNKKWLWEGQKSK